MAEPRICIIAVDNSQDSDFALNWFSKNVYKPGDQAVLVYVPEGHGLLHASKWENTVYSLHRDIMMKTSQDELKQIVSDMRRLARKLRKLRVRRCGLGVIIKRKFPMFHNPDIQCEKSAAGGVEVDHFVWISDKD